MGTLRDVGMGILGNIVEFRTQRARNSIQKKPLLNAVNSEPGIPSRSLLDPVGSLVGLSGVENVGMGTWRDVEMWEYCGIQAMKSLELYPKKVFMSSGCGNSDGSGTWLILPDPGAFPEHCQV